MNINRFKNPYFWVGLVGVVLTTLQVEASSLTSWDKVGTLLLNTIQNPYLLVTAAMAIIGVCINPTTKGLTDNIDKK